jgi:nitrate reductase alpha subunit
MRLWLQPRLNINVSLSMHLDVFIPTEADALRVMAFVRELGGNASPVVDVVEPDYSHLYDKHVGVEQALREADTSIEAGVSYSQEEAMAVLRGEQKVA